MTSRCWTASSRAPAELMNYLAAHKAGLIPDLKEVWQRTNFRESGTWTEVFGDGPLAEEVFQAWHIARYIGRVAAAGKAEYPLPMYANAWLVQHKGQEPGKYPSGGPVARMMDLWRAAAPSIDLLAPDIYLDDFKAVCAEYTQNGNPLFIPEASIALRTVAANPARASSSRSRRTRLCWRA